MPASSDKCSATSAAKLALKFMDAVFHLPDHAFAGHIVVRRFLFQASDAVNDITGSALRHCGAP